MKMKHSDCVFGFAVFASLCFLLRFFLDLGSKTSVQVRSRDLTWEIDTNKSSLAADQDSEFECFLFVMTLSTVNGTERRNAIRQTWMLAGRSVVPKVTVKFIIGTLSLAHRQIAFLEQEQNQFDDLIFLSNLQESYTNLTRKVLWSFIHIDKLYSFKYLLKADDDTFVQLDKLVYELNRRMSHNRFYKGYFAGNNIPSTKGKYTERDWHLCDRYLPYALGGGYILSHDLVSRITVNADGLKMFNSEDVSVGLWLSSFDIIKNHDVRFDTQDATHSCQNVHLVAHKQTGDMMREKYDNLKTIGTQCKTEKQRENLYYYNWKVPPSKCCRRRSGLIKIVPAKITHH